MSKSDPKPRIQDGVFIQAGRSRRPLPSHEAIIKTDAKRKVASLLLPVVRERKTVILPGAASGSRIRTRRPDIYVNLSDAADSQFLLLRLSPKGNHREVSELTILPIRRDVVKKEEVVFAHIRGYTHRRFKITPVEPLTPGEYGLVKLPKLNPLNNKQVAVGTTIWDFGVDGFEHSPRAPHP